MDARGSGARDPEGNNRVVADVPAALLAAKTAPPVPVPGLLPRSDVVTQLVASPAKLILISAPAGWGKTCLLAAWRQAEAQTRPFAFLGLEEGDDDAAVFWTYVIAALRTVHPGFMASEDEALRTPGMDPLRLVVPQLVNELGEIDEPIVLVLDDFHLTTQPGLHESVGYLVDHLPPKVCLVIATRADPPLPLGRLRASGEMTEIRSAQLALTPAETTQLLGERFDLHIDAAGVELLCRHTEGWPAALHLAGLSLQRQDDPKGFIERFAGDDRNVADYLTSEVLDRLSDEQKDFLLRTCILDHLSGPLCDVVAGVTGSAAMLEELDRSNLFLIPLDNRRDWYRYHHLFVEWLRHRLRRTNPELAPQLHARASRWHAENNSLGPAIAHAIAGGDQTRAAELIDRFLVRPSGVRWSTFWDWLDQLPDDIVATHPMIALARVAPALARGDFSSGWHWIGIAEAAIATAPAELRSGYETIAGLYRAFCELAAGDKGVAQAALGGISEELRLAGSRSYPIAIGLAGMATFWSVGALESIPELQAASVARERASLPDGGVTALLAAAYAELGDWAAAEATAEAALALPRPWEHYSYPDRMAAHYAIGKVRMAAGRRDEGIDQIKQGLDLARGWVEPVFIAYGCLALAEAMEDYSEKRALVREARQLAESSSDPARVSQLVTAAERNLSMRQPPRHTEGTAYVEPLTDRERDVLRLLRSKLSLREIAGELYISHNTVKGYAKSIYRKLGVSSREAALDAARELNLS